MPWLLIGGAIVISVLIMALIALAFTPKGSNVEDPMVTRRNAMIRAGQINPNRDRLSD